MAKVVDEGKKIKAHVDGAPRSRTTASLVCITDHVIVSPLLLSIMIELRPGRRRTRYTRSFMAERENSKRSEPRASSYTPERRISGEKEGGEILDISNGGFELFI